MPDEPLLTGRDESTPFRAMHRVVLVVAVAVVVVGVIAYVLWSTLN